MSAYGAHRKKLSRLLKQKIVEAGGEGIHVRCGRGTAWGWLDVSGSLPGGEFTPAQRQAVENVTHGRAGGNFWVGTLEDVGRILGIPSPP